MTQANKASKLPEHVLVRRQIINQILHMDLGLRRGFNHDLVHTGDEEDDLVRYFLKKDRYYQDMVNRTKYSRCIVSADNAIDRYSVFEDVIADLIDGGGLYCQSDKWWLKPSLVDEHRGVGRRRGKRQTAFNDASYHGRPRRDRGRQLAHVA